MVADDPESFADLDGHTSQGRDAAPSCAAQGQGASGAPASNGCKTSQPAEPAKDQKQAADGAPPKPATPKPPPEASDRTKYPTADQAAKAAVNAINPQSISQDKEYAGRGYKNADGTYSTTAPVQGDQASSTPPPISSLPSGATNAFRFHTHGGADPGYDNEHFSPADKRNARNEHVSSYLGTPSGAIKRYNPFTNRIVILQPGAQQQ